MDSIQTNNSLTSFKFLKRIKKKNQKSNHPRDLTEDQLSLESHAKKSFQSGFAIDSQKSSFIDVFNVKKPSKIVPNEILVIGGNAASKNYNMQKYFSESLEKELKQMAIQKQFSNKSGNLNLKKKSSKQFQENITPNLKTMQQQNIQINYQQIFDRSKFNDEQTNKKKEIKPFFKNQKEIIKQSTTQSINMPIQIQKSPINNLNQYNQSQQSNKMNILLKCEVCLRKFNQNSYNKHILICQKVFFKKRKEFNSANQRAN